MGWYELITADISEETLLQYWAKTEDFSKVIHDFSDLAATYKSLQIKFYME